MSVTATDMLEYKVLGLPGAEARGARDGAPQDHGSAEGPDEVCGPAGDQGPEPALHPRQARRPPLLLLQVLRPVLLQPGRARRDRRLSTRRRAAEERSFYDRACVRERAQ